MKKLLALGVLIATVVISGCYYGPCMSGSGPIVTEERAIVGFTGVRNSGDFEVLVSQAAAYSVKVEAYENLLPIIETYISGYTLVVKSRDNSCYKSGPSVKVYVTLPELDVLELNGSGSIRADVAESKVFECANNGSGFVVVESVYAENVYLANAGSGAIDVNKIVAGDVNYTQSGSGVIDTGVIMESESVSIKHSSSGHVRTALAGGIRLDAILSGSGRIDLSGEVVDADYTLNSSGRIDALELMAIEAMVANSGSGPLFVWAIDKLEVAITGSGDVIYRGDPSLSFRITGSGILRPY